MGGSRGVPGGFGPPGKSKEAIGFLRNTGTDPLRCYWTPWIKQLGPFSPIAGQKEICTTLCDSVNYVDG